MEQYKLNLIEQPEQSIVSIRYQVAVEQLPSLIGPAFQKLAAFISENGAQIAGAPFTAFHGLDEQFHLNERCMDVEIGFPYTGELPNTIDIQCGRIPAGKAVSCHYKGAYAEMTPIYEAIARYVNENGYKSAGSTYEYYASSPDVPENEHETTIILPLSESLLMDSFD